MVISGHFTGYDSTIFTAENFFFTKRREEVMKKGGSKHVNKDHGGIPTSKRAHVSDSECDSHEQKRSGSPEPQV